VHAGLIVRADVGSWVFGLDGANRLGLRVEFFDIAGGVRDPYGLEAVTTVSLPTFPSGAALLLVMPLPSAIP
jgi:hypothetical protein